MIALLAPLMVCCVILAGITTAALPNWPGISIVLLAVAAGCFLYCATYRGERQPT